MNDPILFSFFSGSGFLDLGFEKTGFDIGLVNEYHKPFLEAYKYTRHNMKYDEPHHGHHECSIEDFLTGASGKRFSSLVAESKSSGNLVGFIGGPPCPDFSVAGKNKGRDGENGKLTRSYVDLIIKDNPDYFIFENVKGLWRTKLHREFYDNIKLLLENAGYVLTDRLTNSIEFGAPQDRDRIFMFGIKREYVSSKLNSGGLTSMFNWEKHLSRNDIGTVLDKTMWPQENLFEENSETDYRDFISDDLKPLTVQHWFDKNDVSNHANSNHCFKPKSDKFKFIKEGDDSKKSFKRLHRWRYSPTAAYGNNEVHLHPYQARRINAAEALAIQSLPKEFSLPMNMTLSDMFKTIGNGVPFVAAKGLAHTVKDFLTEECT